jgi:hypothetical protein
MGAINEFIASVDRQGVALSSEFEVKLHLPEDLEFGATEGNQLLLRAAMAEIPSRQIQTVQDRSLNSGLPRNIPLGMVYTETNISFILSEDLRERVLMEVWQEKIADAGLSGNSADHPRFRTTYYGKLKSGSVTVARKFQTGKVSGYTSSFFGLRRHENLKSEESYAVTFYEAYPIAIGQINQDWSNESVMLLPVTFAYRYWLRDSKWNQSNLKEGTKSFSTNPYGLLNKGLSAAAKYIPLP